MKDPSQLFNDAMEALTNGDIDGVGMLKEAAELGNAYAQNNYAMILYTGDLVDRDQEEAFRWFRAAAEGGIDESQFHLGLEYYEGTLVDKDYKEALNGSGSPRRRDTLRHSTIWVFAIITDTACSGTTVSRSIGSHWPRRGTILRQ